MMSSKATRKLEYSKASCAGSMRVSIVGLMMLIIVNVVDSRKVVVNVTVAGIRLGLNASTIYQNLLKLGVPNITGVKLTELGPRYMKVTKIPDLPVLVLNSTCDPFTMLCQDLTPWYLILGPNPNLFPAIKSDDSVVFSPAFGVNNPIAQTGPRLDIQVERVSNSLTLTISLSKGRYHIVTGSILSATQADHSTDSLFVAIDQANVTLNVTSGPDGFFKVKNGTNEWAVQFHTRRIIGITGVSSCSNPIKWSALGGIDETCNVEIKIIWNTGEITSVQDQPTVCTVGSPCIIKYQGFSSEVDLGVWIPYSPKIRAGRTMIGIQERTLWSCTVSLWKSNQVLDNVEVTSQLRQQHCLEVFPEDILTIGDYYLEGKGTGVTSITVGSSKITISVLHGASEVSTLEAVLVSSSSITSNGTNVTVKRTEVLLEGLNTTLWLFANYTSGYQTALQGSDLVTFYNLHPCVSLSTNNSVWNVLVKPGCTIVGLGQAFTVSYHNVTLQVNAIVAGKTPIGILACCSQYLAKPMDISIAGLYPTNATLSYVTVLYQYHPVDVILVSSGSVSLVHDSTGLEQLQKGVFVARQNATLGVTVISVGYRGFQSNISVYVVQTGSLLLEAPDKTLRRLHCSALFQTLSVVSKVSVLGTGLIVIQYLYVNMSLMASNGSIVDIKGPTVTGKTPGNATITGSWGLLSNSFVVSVVNESLLLGGLIEETYLLHGISGSSFDIEVKGMFMGSNEVAVLPPGLIKNNLRLGLNHTSSSYENILLRSTECQGVQVNASSRLALNMQPSGQSLDIDVGKITGLAIPASENSSVMIPIRLQVNSSGVIGFYLTVYTNQHITDCQRGSEFYGLFACNFETQPGIIRMAGVFLDFPSFGVFEIGVIQTTLFNEPTVWTELQVFDANGLRNAQTPSGTIGNPPGQMPLRYQTNNIQLDLSTVIREYKCYLTFNCDYLPVFSMAVLVENTYLVDPFLYSDSLEISTMVRVTNRFAQIQTSQVQVHFQFNPPIPGYPEIITGEQLVGGWVAVQLRTPAEAQAQARLFTNVTFRLVTLDTNNKTTPERIWTNPPQQLQIGIPAPTCPRYAYYQANLRFSYMIIGNFSGLNTSSLAVSSRLACILHIPRRRLYLSLLEEQTKLNISVDLETFSRRRTVENELFGPNTTIFTQFFKTLGCQITAMYASSDIGFIKDLPDTPRDCPVDWFFNTQTGLYTPLPLHSIQGPDCYDFVCDAGYAQASEQAIECIPQSVQAQVYWSVVLISALGIVGVCITGSFLRGAWVITREIDSGEKTIQMPEDSDNIPEPDNTLPVETAVVGGEMVFVFETEEKI